MYWVRIIGLSALLTVAALAENAKNTSGEAFIIGVEDNHYLPHYTFEGGQYRGFARELLDGFFSAKGYRYEFRPLPVSRLLQSFIDGQVDFKYPDTFLWYPELKRGKAIVYSAPVVGFTDGISVLPQNKGKKYNKFKVLGTVRGFATPPWTHQHIVTGGFEVLENDSFQGIVEQALIGRVDGIYANVDVVRYLLDQVLHQPDGLVFDDTIPYISGYYRLSTLKHPEVIEEFDQWLQTHADYIRTLKNKYNLASESKPLAVQ